MAAHSQFGGLFPQAGILLEHAGRAKAVAYCKSAQEDETAGFVMTAAFEWRRAAECFGWDVDEADRCWCNWERLMRLPRWLAHAVGGDVAEVEEFETRLMAA
jgi:hypothetical protein